MRKRMFVLTVVFVLALGTSYFPGVPTALSNPRVVKASAQGVQLFDFGDAPDPSYPTLLASDGARHVDVSGEWLGSIDNCTNTTTTEPDALVVDLDNDDGLWQWWMDPTSGSLFIQVGVNIAASAPPGTRYLNVLIDRNMDGNWTGVDEWPIQNAPLDLPPGTCSFPTTLNLGPAPTPPLDTWVRITLTRDPILTNPWTGTGEFPFGETEDWHLVWDPGLPPGAGGPGPSPSLPPVLAISLTCVPPIQGMVHGGPVVNYSLAYTLLPGTPPPNKAKASTKFFGLCEGACGTPTSPFGPFGWNLANNTEFPPGAPLPPGGDAVNLLNIAGINYNANNPHGLCFPANESYQIFKAWYVNNDPTLGPVGFALSTTSCHVHVQHPPMP